MAIENMKKDNLPKVDLTTTDKTISKKQSEIKIKEITEEKESSITVSENDWNNMLAFMKAQETRLNKLEEEKKETQAQQITKSKDDDKQKTIDHLLNTVGDLTTALKDKDKVDTSKKDEVIKGTSDLQQRVAVINSSISKARQLDVKLKVQAATYFAAESAKKRPFHAITHEIYTKYLILLFDTRQLSNSNKSGDLSILMGQVPILISPKVKYAFLTPAQYDYIMDYIEMDTKKIADIVTNGKKPLEATEGYKQSSTVQLALNNPEEFGAIFKKTN